MPTRIALPPILAAILVSQAVAQQSMTGVPAPASPDDLGALAETVRGIAADKVLIRDLLGKEVTGTDGDAIGTVEDFAIIPGGALPGAQLVAAIVVTPDGDRLALPFTVVRIGMSGATRTLSLPFAASEVTGVAALSDLAADLTGHAGGNSGASD